MFPFGYYLLVHRSRASDRWLGFLVAASGILGIVTSGARGAYVSILVATPAFVALWLIRTVRLKPRSLAPAFVTVAGGAGFAGLIILIFTWARLYNRVIGGNASDQNSTQARWDQWHMALPHIQANPLTGHGVGTGAGCRGLFQPRSRFPNSGQHANIHAGRDGCPRLSFFLRVGDFRDCSRRQEISAGLQRSRRRRGGIVVQLDCFPGLLHRAIPTRRISPSCFCSWD